MPCCVRQKLEMLRLWNKLIMINNERLVKKIFLWDRLLCKNHWCKEIKSMGEEIESLSSFEK